MPAGQPLWHFQLRLPPGTHAQIKALAAERKTTIRAVQIDAIEALLRRRAAGERLPYRAAATVNEVVGMHLPVTLKPKVVKACRHDHITLASLILTALLEYLERLPHRPAPPLPKARPKAKRYSTFTLTLAPELHDRMRAIAADRGVLIQDVYAEALEQLLARRKMEPDMHYVAPRGLGVQTLISTRPDLRAAVVKLAQRDRVTKAAILTTAILDYLAGRQPGGPAPPEDIG